MNIHKFIKENINEQSVFFEIGSHFGIDTEIIFNNTRSSIHCFEPDPRNIKIMEKNGISKIVKKINQVAISDYIGKSIFYLSSGNPPQSFENQDLNNNSWSASNSLKKPKVHLEKNPWCKFEDFIEVDCITLEHYCKNNKISHIDFIWMDVQGAEDMVLRGLGELKENIKFIYTEYNEEEIYENSTNKEQILNLLGTNWEIIYDFGGDLLVKNKNFILD